MDTDTCITNFPTSDEFKCENAESQLKDDDKDAFLFNLTMNPQRGPDKKRIRKPEKTKSERPRYGEEDERYLSLEKREIDRREALNRSIISLQLGLEGSGRMQRRRKRKRKRKKKRTQKRRRKKRKRRTRR